MTKEEVKKAMLRHIKGHNRYMTEEYLNTLSVRQAMCEVHPTYRDYFEELIRKIKD